MTNVATTDIEQLLANATEPFFVLNERGKLVFANRATDDLTGIKAGDIAARERLESELLVAPADLPNGQVRMARRVWGEGKNRSWLAITFLPITGSNGQTIAILGHIARAQEQSPVTPSIDSLAIEHLERLREEHRARWGIEAVPARSPAMQRVMDQLILAASADLAVSFVGENGTGKKTLAKILHVASKRRSRNLVVLDCRALPAESQRAELLDITHITTRAEQRGDDDSRGRLLDESAGGTLVIVGIAKLATDLQELLVRTFGNADPPLWRIIATEREPLERALADGRLTESLYYLLTRVVIDVPPLRDRLAELSDLITQTLEGFLKNDADLGTVAGIDPAALDALRKYDWPGNLTELETVLRGAVRRATKPFLAVRDLPKKVIRSEPTDPAGETGTKIVPLDELLESVERRMIDLALRRHKGNKSKAAEELGISRPRLHRRAEQLGFSLGPLEENPPGKTPTDL